MPNIRNNWEGVVAFLKKKKSLAQTYIILIKVHDHHTSVFFRSSTGDSVHTTRVVTMLGPCLHGSHSFGSMTYNLGGNKFIKLNKISFLSHTLLLKSTLCKQRISLFLKTHFSSWILYFSILEEETNREDLISEMVVLSKISQWLLLITIVTEAMLCLPACRNCILHSWSGH